MSALYYDCLLGLPETSDAFSAHPKIAGAPKNKGPEKLLPSTHSRKTPKLAWDADSASSSRSRGIISVPEGYGYDDEIYGGVAAYACEGPDKGIHFIRLPPPAKGITTKQWTIRDLPAVDFDVEVESELDLIVMTENVAQQ